MKVLSSKVGSKPKVSRERAKKSPTSRTGSKNTSRKKSSISVSSPRKRGRRKGVGESVETKLKRARGRRLWGIYKDKRVFKKYLEGLKDAREFMSEGRIHFLQSVGDSYRKAIYRHFKEVDPEGYKELMVYRRALAKAKKREKEIPLKDTLDETKVEIAQAHYEEEGITKTRFIPFEGILDIIAVLRAAGYSIKEVCAKLRVEPQIVQKVTQADVARMRRRLPEAITMAADKKVMFDLAEGEVDKDTERADRIAARRRKQALEEWDRSEGRNKPTLPSEAKQIRSDHETFFDVKEGK
jgi:DNA-binding transcriptional MerR regulator